VFDRPALLRFLGTAIMVFGAATAIVVTASTLYLWQAEPCTTQSQCAERAAFTSLAKWPAGMGLLVLGLGMFVRSFGRSEK
jgi:hypothetical protein